MYYITNLKRVLLCLGVEESAVVPDKTEEGTVEPSIDTKACFINTNACFINTTACFINTTACFINTTACL